MSRQTLTSLVMIIAMAGTVGLVAFVALMVMGEVDFSPALFFAIVAAGVAAVALFVGLFRDDEPSNRAARTPKPQDRDLTPERFKPGRAGVEPGSAGVEPGSAGRSGPGASQGAFGFAATEGDKPSTAVEAPGPASAGDQAGNAPSSAHGGMPSGNATLDRGIDDDAPPHGRPNVAVPGKDDDRLHRATDTTGPAGIRNDDDGPDARTESRETVTIGTEPPRLGEPREGGPDDLTRIHGVDAEIEAQLHRHGIFHFDQIAGWNRHETVWIEETLGGLDGRVDRENWIDQSRNLSDRAETRETGNAGA